jgi:hypothetical protein
MRLVRWSVLASRFGGPLLSGLLHRGYKLQAVREAFHAFFEGHDFLQYNRLGNS